MLLLTNRLWRTIVSALLIIAIVLTPTTVFAVTKKTVADIETYTKRDGRTTCLISEKKLKKKATTIKKGTTKLYFKKGKGWLKFKAPKTKTYTFRVSDMVTKETSTYTPSEFCIYKPNRSGVKWYFGITFSGETDLALADVRTRNGKSGNFWLSIGSSTYAKIRIEKGETAYIRIDSSHDEKPTSKSARSFKIKIK